MINSFTESDSVKSSIPVQLTFPQSFAVEVPLDVQFVGKGPNSAYPFSSTVNSRLSGRGSTCCALMPDWSLQTNAVLSLAAGQSCECCVCICSYAGGWPFSIGWKEV